MEERLIELFKEYLPAWSWEEWQAAGASDKEDIVINALADLGPEMPIEVDEAYDIFWDWAAGITEADFGRKITESTAEDPYGYGPYKVPTDPKLEVGDYIKAKRYSSDTKWYPARVTRITPDFVDYTISGFGFIKNGTAVRSASAKQAFGNLRKRLLGEACEESLTEADFSSDLQEANKVVRGAANRPWYSGSFRGLNDIDTRVTPEEKARVAAENEARRQRQAELEAERRAAALERRKQMAIKVAEDAIAKGVIDEYNEAHRASILASPNVYPAIDPETQELVFDKAEQRRILDPITQRVNAEKEAKKAAEKEAAKKAAERREAEKPITYYLYAEVVINGETMRDPDGTRVVGQDNLVSAAKEVAREELKWVNTEHKFYVAGGHPFNWDGVITIICENPDGTEKPFRTFRVRTNEGLEEEFEGSLSDFDGDPNEILRSFTNEYSYSGDAADLACISNRSCPSKVTNSKEAEQAAIRKSKEDAQLQAKCLAAAQKAIETGDIEIYNRGRWSRFILTKDFCPAVDPETLELVYDPVRKSEIYNQARRAYFERQSEYRTNYAARRKAKTAGNIEEAVRVVSDPDVLYHATEVGPFYDILNSGVMLHDVRNEGGVHAICFTTDDNYSIHGYPCKIKFSRSKLEQGGYELYPVDEFEDDDYGSGESEERCDEDINDVRKYVTEVIIDWEFIAVMQDGDDCRLSTGEYDEEGNESDNWDLKLSDFRALLDSLKASGIKVIEKGQPEADDDYWFDETGEFKYGKEPAFV